MVGPIKASPANTLRDTEERAPGWALRWLVATPCVKGSNPARLFFIDTATENLKRRMKEAEAPLRSPGPVG